MTDPGIEVDGGEFWVVEIRDGGGETDAWVYATEEGAIDELMRHVPWDEIDLDDVDMEDFFGKYSIQRVEIGDQEYSVHGVPPHRVLLAQIQQQQ